MSGQYSIDEMRRFLDWAAEKGVINRATALSWRTAVDKVFSDPDGIDTDDLRGLKQDLEEVLRRFGNLHVRDYTPASLRTYQGRVRSAIQEFLRYADDPAHYAPKVGRRSRTRSSASAGGSTTNTDVDPGRSGVGNSPSGGAATDALTIPIPIREGMTVQIRGLPRDLTSTEADKVANVVKAYATLDK